MTLLLSLPLSPQQCMNGRLIRVLTMTRRIITLFQASYSSLLSLSPHVERFQGLLCLPPYEFPPFLAPALLDGRGWHFGRSVRPSGWRLSFHISITSVAFCIWTRVWSLPLLRQSNSLRRSLTPSFNRSRSILKRSERRWAEEGGVATSLSPLAGRPSVVRIWAALSQQCSDSYRCGS